MSNDRHTEGPLSIPEYLRNVIDELRTRISSSEPSKLANSEKLRLSIGLKKLHRIKQSCFEEELGLLLNPAPAGLASHVRAVLTRDWLSGECPNWKSPPFIRKLAKNIDHHAQFYSCRLRSPWFNGFDHLGVEPKSNLFPNARPLTESETAILEGFPDTDHDILNKTLLTKEPCYLEKEDPACIRQGFDFWRAQLFDNVRLLNCPDNDSSFGTYSFYSPTKWCETSKTFGKIRLIINDRPRNTLFNPTTEHIELAGHAKLKEVISYCINRNYDSTWKATRNNIQASLREDKAREQTLRATWADFPPRACTATEDPMGFLPVLGKTDLSGAYYQLPISKYWLNKVFIPSPDGWIPKFSAVLTFGNKKSVLSMQGFTEFVCRVCAKYLGIPVIGYIDDFIIFATGALGDLYHQAVLEVFALLGFTVTTKKSGSFPPKMDVPADILGLDYLSSGMSVSITASPDRIAKIKREIAEFSGALMTSRLISENALQRVYGQISFISCNKAFATEGPLLTQINPVLADDPNSWNADKRAQVCYYLAEASTRISANRPLVLSTASSSRPAFYIYSDAMATRTQFGMAWVLHTPKGATYWAWRGPRSDLGSRFRKLNIFELEVLAALAALDLCQKYLDGPANIHLKVDNMGAAHSFVRGGSSKSTAACVFIDKFYELIQKLDLRFLITYISTKRNISDEPSRLSSLVDSVPPGICITECTDTLDLSKLEPKVCAHDRRAAYIRGRSKPDPDLQKPIAPSSKKCPVGRSNFSVRKDIAALDSRYAKSTLAQVRKVFGKASAKPL